MVKEQSFACRTVWTGAAEGPTESLDDYSRDFVVEIEGKAPLRASAEASFQGDSSRHNPEDLLVAALSGCHLLSYLAFCGRDAVAVVSYEDAAEGTLAIKDGRMRFTEVVLRPKVVVAAGSDVEKARELHDAAHHICFVANSVNFPVRHEASVEEAG